MTEAKKEEKAKAEEKKEVKATETAGAKESKPKADKKEKPAAEAKKEKPKKEEKVDIVSENIYTIPLRAAYQTRPKYRISSKAVNMIRVFLTRHAKAKEVLIDADLNAYIWARGDTKPPRKIQVKAVKDSKGIVKASLVK
jgi:large subunit ribosomal protein L31e